MKENFNQAIEWGKKNPIIVIALFTAIVFIFFRGQRPVEPAEVGIGERVRGQAFPQPFEKTAVQYPKELQDAHQEYQPRNEVEKPVAVLTPTPVIPQSLIAKNQPSLIPGWRPLADYNVLGARLYKDVIAAKHAAMVPGVPDRPVANGLIKTVAHGWQTPEQIKVRQYERYSRYRAAGMGEIADKVKRETELAIGQRTGW